MLRECAHNQYSSWSEEEEKWHGLLSPLVHKLTHLFSSIMEPVSPQSDFVILCIHKAYFCLRAFVLVFSF